MCCIVMVVQIQGVPLTFRKPEMGLDVTEFHVRMYMGLLCYFLEIRKVFMNVKDCMCFTAGVLFGRKMNFCFSLWELYLDGM